MEPPVKQKKMSLHAGVGALAHDSIVGGDVPVLAIEVRETIQYAALRSLNTFLKKFQESCQSTRFLPIASFNDASDDNF